MQFGGPFFLNKLLAAVDNGSPAALGYAYAFMMLVTMMTSTLADNQQFQLVMRAGMRFAARLPGAGRGGESAREENCAGESQSRGGKGEGNLRLRELRALDHEKAEGRDGFGVVWPS